MRAPSVRNRIGSSLHQKIKAILRAGLLFLWRKDTAMGVAIRLLLWSFWRFL